MLSAIILAALVKLNTECEGPWFATGIFASVGFLFSLMLGVPFLAILIGTAINVGLGFLYFWLLKKTEGSTVWWVIMITGIVIFLFL